MKELDWFGHWGYAFILVGQYYVGCKEPMGWLFRFFGEALWIIIGVILGMSSIWVWGCIFMALDLHNFEKWQAEEKAKLAEAHLVAEAESYLDELFTEVKIENKQRESEGPKVATKRSRKRAKKVQPARRRRSVKTNGKRRSRSNDVRKGTKRSRR